MIATLPPSNRLNALRTLVKRIRRTRAITSAQDFAHTPDSLRDLKRPQNDSRERHAMNCIDLQAVFGTRRPTAH